jgi:hypothetical protein
MLTMPIRQILEFPEEYRAIPVEEARPRRRRRPAPSLELVERQEQLTRAGIKSRMLYDRNTRSYCLAFRLAPGEEVPAWQ